MQCLEEGFIARIPKYGLMAKSWTFLTSSTSGISFMSVVILTILIRRLRTT